MSTEWFATLHDGDKVILAQDGYPTSRRVTSVRLTSTQIIVEGTPRRFDRQTGNIKGKWDYHAPYLLPYTPEAALKIRLTRTTADMIAALKKITPETLDLPQAAKLHGLLTQGLAALADYGLYPRESAALGAGNPTDTGSLRGSRQGDDTEPLKPCPRCGDAGIMTCTDLTTTGTNVYRVRCLGCGFKRKWCATQQDAAAQWQRARGPRAPEKPVP